VKNAVVLLAELATVKLEIANVLTDGAEVHVVEGTEKLELLLTTVQLKVACLLSTGMALPILLLKCG